MRKRIIHIAFIFLLSLLICSIVFASSRDFQEGFKDGYITGFKQASKTSIKPIVPPCPIQPIKSIGDPKSDYEHGYTIGYRRGFADGSK